MQLLHFWTPDSACSPWKCFSLAHTLLSRQKAVTSLNKPSESQLQLAWIDDWFYLSRSDAPVSCWFQAVLRNQYSLYTLNQGLTQPIQYCSIVPWFLFFCVAVLIWQLNTTLWLVLANINSIQSSGVHMILTFTLNASIVRWSWDCSQASNFSFLECQGLLAALQYCQRAPSSLLHPWFRWLDSEHLKFNSKIISFDFFIYQSALFPTST